MNHTIVEAIYAIRHKESGEYVRANGKGCWMSKGAAQSSFNNCSLGSAFTGVGKWAYQDEYEIVDVLGSYSDLSESMDQASALNNQLVVKIVEKEEELDEWIHSNKVDELQRHNNWLMDRVSSLEQELETAQQWNFDRS